MLRTLTDASVSADVQTWEGWFGPHSISVVIPALNEAANLKEVLPRIPDWVDEVILVDGNSTDDTVAVARECLPRIKVVRQAGRGKGDALREGFGAVSGDVIVMLDADGSTDPAEIPLFVGALLAGADFAKGTRFVQGGGSADLGMLRRLGNAAFTIMFRLLFGNRCSDLCYGYNAFWAYVPPALQLDADGFEVEAQMNVRVLRAGLRMVEVPSYESQRLSGTSHLHAFRDGWRVLRVIWGEWMKERSSVLRGLGRRSIKGLS
jgi:glycosyltransferase involved in cell wall biosynthesis